MERPRKCPLSWRVAARARQRERKNAYIAAGRGYSSRAFAIFRLFIRKAGLLAALDPASRGYKRAETLRTSEKERRIVRLASSPEAHLRRRAR